MRSAPCKLQRPYVAVVAEKPKAASRIAQALGQATLCRIGGIPVYYVRFNGQLLVIVSSAGHMFGPTTAVEGLPVTELKWEPLWSFERRSKHLRPYYEVLAKTLPGALAYISACDYDLEGSTICYKIIEAFGDLKRARRAKFSSLTAGELRKAFMNLGPLDVNNAMAGVARYTVRLPLHETVKFEYTWPEPCWALADLSTTGTLARGTTTTARTRTRRPRANALLELFKVSQVL